MNLEIITQLTVLTLMVFHRPSGNEEHGKEWLLNYSNGAPAFMGLSGHIERPILLKGRLCLHRCANPVKLDSANLYLTRLASRCSTSYPFARENLTGKETVVFGDATHAASITKIPAREMGIRVSYTGTYCENDAKWFKEKIQGFCDEILITDDHIKVGDMIARAEPSALFGTQMERHIGKRLDIPRGVISSPVHIQNFSLGYRPFLGYEDRFRTFTDIGDWRFYNSDNFEFNFFVQRNYERILVSFHSAPPWEIDRV
eukprot:Gb_14516 [translate_table: standard]